MKFSTFLARKPSAGLDVKAKLAAARLRMEQLSAQAEAEAGAPQVWEPDPDNKPQTNAYHSVADVLGYGGQAGGGKTDLIIGLAATQHAKSIIFRRESTQLKDIIARAKGMTEDFRTGFNGTTGMLTLGRRTIEFGAMKDASDWEKFKGRPHDLKAYDEATEILEMQFRATSGWNRTTVPGQRCRIVLTFNPPTNEEGMWVIRYFAPWLDDTHPNPAKPGEIRWFAMVDDEEIERPDGQPFAHPDKDGRPVLGIDGQPEMIEPQSRTFIPARLADNKHLAKTGYGRTLMALPEPLRSQLLKGDFKAGVGVDPWLVIPPAWVDAAQARWVAREAAGTLQGPMTCLGVDVAHGGKDKTVLAPRRGNWIDRLLKYPGKATPDGKSAASLVVAAMEPGTPVNIDLIGWGASCYERLIDNPPEGFGVGANGVNFAERSEHMDRSGKYKMANQRAEAYWRFREELDPENGSDLALPPDPELKADLCSARYEVRPSGITIEKKADVAERIGRSPDCGDAVVLTALGAGSLPAQVAGPIPKLAKTPNLELMMPSFGIPGSLI